MDKLNKIFIFFNITWLFFILISASSSAQGLIIKKGATLVNKGNFILKGNWVNEGLFLDTSATVIFSGTTQTIGGIIPSTFNNLTIALGSSTTIISPGQSLSRVLLCNGTLTGGGNITLLSKASQTALIDGSSTGQVNGNVTMQRFLSSGFGYKFFSSPFQGATVNDFGDDMNLLASFPAFYKYDESRVSSGWVTYTNPAGVLNPINGYAVNFGSSLTATTVDITGVVNNGRLSVTLYNHNNIYTKGFNLVGNPYPSPIDWNAATGWTKTNIDNALYYFKAGTTDQNTGAYSTYVNGISSDGLATNIIPSMQAFFIHVSNGAWPVTGILAMDNRVRINDFSHLFLKSVNINSISFLRLTAYYGNTPDSFDPLVIYFDENAHVEFDSRLDALKLMNTDSLIPNLYSIATDGNNLSINALPIPTNKLLIVPVGLKTTRNGSIIFMISDTVNLPSGTQIYLHDKETGTDRILNLNEGYNIYLNAGEYNNRFSLRFTKGTKDTSGINLNKDPLIVYNSNDKIIAAINLKPGNKGALSISNLSGQIMFNKEIYESCNQELNSQLIPGIYIIYFISGNVEYTKKIIILRK
jgi:hypothetical protein